MDKKEKEELLKKIEEYTNKIKEEPNNASNYSILGEIFECLKKKEAACKNYKRSLELKYDILSKKKIRLLHNILYNGKVKFLFLERSTNKSVYNFYPDLINGIISFDKKKYRDAITYFDKAIKLDPKPDKFYYYYKGSAYFYLGRYETATMNFKIALDLKKLEEEKIMKLI